MPARSHPALVQSPLRNTYYQAFYSAHPTTDAETGETFNIGIGGSKGSLEISRLSPDGVLDNSASFMPPASYFWHDNTITEEYVIGVTSPYVLGLPSLLWALLGFGQVGEAFQWDPNGKSEVCHTLLPGWHV